MLLTQCKKCGLTLEIAGTPGEFDLLSSVPAWSVSFPCVTPLCSSRATRQRVLQLEDHTEFRVLSVQEYWRALNGFGLPDAPAVTLRSVTDLIRTHTIVDLIGVDVDGTERVIVNCLVLDDGTRLHFAPSSRGACVYYIESGAKHATNRIAVRDSESGEPHREEAGRASDGGEAPEPDVRPESVLVPNTVMSSVPEERGLHPSDS